MADRKKPITENAAERLEKKLTERQKILARHIVAMFVADILQEESLVDSGVNNYEDLYQLTQGDGFVRWQESMVQRDYGTDVTTAQAVLATAIQLESADTLLQSLYGYTNYVRKQLAVALANVKHTAYRVISSDEEAKAIVADDQEGNQWQIYLSPDAPDSVKIKRVPPSKLNPPGGNRGNVNRHKGKKKKLTKKKRGRRKTSTSSSPPSPRRRERSE